MMDENISTAIHEEYRNLWAFVAELKAKSIRLNEIKDSLTEDRFNSLSKEYADGLRKLKDEFEATRQKAESQIKSSQAEVTTIENRLLTLDKKKSDIEVLQENNLIDEIQFTKECKMLKLEFEELNPLLNNHEKIISDNQLALKYPNPDDHAKSIADKKKKEKIELEKKERAEKEALEQQKKEERDFQFQVKKAEAEITHKANERFIKYKKQSDEIVNNLEVTKTKLQNEFNEFKKQNSSLKIKVDEQADNIEMITLKSDKYDEVINNLEATKTKLENELDELKKQNSMLKVKVDEQAYKTEQEQKLEFQKRRKGSIKFVIGLLTIFTIGQFSGVFISAMAGQSSNPSLFFSILWPGLLFMSIWSLKEKRKIIGLLIGIIIGFLLQFSAGVVAGHSQAEVRAIDKVIATINEGLPKMIDEETRIDSIAIDQKMKLYSVNMTLINYQASDIDIDVLKDNFEQSIKSAICETQQYELFFTEGYTIFSVYKDKDGNLISKYSALPADCK